MIEIKCPKCGEKIKLGVDDYNLLLKEIENEEFQKRITSRTKEIEENFKIKIELFERDKQSEIEKSKNDFDLELNKKDIEINNLKNSLNNIEEKNKLELEKKVIEYNKKLEMKDSEIARWKDFQVGNSTKDLGESLEIYCENKFNEIRATAYPNAEFNKDNIVDEEGKGDYIFRNYIEGIESTSIMFEMKNQNTTTKTKHKNEDFFDKLDKNRKSKGCEYAVLVSTLEEDSILYNKGIVDVSYKHPNMYVVRPQHFLTIISLIDNMAKSNFKYKKELIEAKDSVLDITNFEENVRNLFNTITADYEKANEIYNKVDKLCDDIIGKVNNFRYDFKKANNWIGRAQKKLPDLELKKLTRGNKTMKEKFEELKKSMAKPTN